MKLDFLQEIPNFNNIKNDSILENRIEWNAFWFNIDKEVNDIETLTEYLLGISYDDDAVNRIVGGGN